MKFRPALVALTGSASLLAAGSTQGEFLGVTLSWKGSDEPFPGVVTFNLVAKFDAGGGDRITSVSGTESEPLYVHMFNGSIYQHKFGGDTAPTQQFVDIFPSLAFDTFVTIGTKIADGDTTTLGREWPGFTSNQLLTTTSGWSIGPNDPQGLPDADNRVVLGQFSIIENDPMFSFFGRFVLCGLSEGVPFEEYVEFSAGYDGAIGGACCLADKTCEVVLWPDDCVGIYVAINSVCDLNDCTCPIDFDGDGAVGTTDLLQLLAAWGTYIKGVPDLNGDVTVSTADLLILLGAWGKCR